MKWSQAQKMQNLQPEQDKTEWHHKSHANLSGFRKINFALDFGQRFLRYYGILSSTSKVGQVLSCIAHFPLRESVSFY